jgi:hypothetical protein
VPLTKYVPTGSKPVVEIAPVVASTRTPSAVLVVTYVTGPVLPDTFRRPEKALEPSTDVAPPVGAPWEIVPAADAGTATSMKVPVVNNDAMNSEFALANSLFNCILAT